MRQEWVARAVYDGLKEEIESLRAERDTLSNQLSESIEIIVAAERGARVMAGYLNDRRELRWDDELLNAIDAVIAASP